MLSVSPSQSSEELIKGHDSTRLRGLPSPEREVWIATHDLEELDLIDLEGVRFLNACEAKGDLDPALFALH